MNNIRNYFSLRFTLVKRQLADFGINPWLGILLIAGGFIAFSFYLFQRTTYAPMLYAVAAVVMMMRYSEVNRNSFLRFTFSTSTFYRIRLIENLLTVLPFAILLLFKQAWMPLIVLLIISVVLVLVKTSRLISISFPTPFYKKPFEFIIGFRTWLPVLLLAWFLVIMSVLYQNFNLGIFAMIVVFLVCMAFYNQPEDPYYVWVHKLSAHKFLFDKMGTAVLFSTLLCLPVTLALLYFFPDDIRVLSVFQLAGYCYLITVILAKYSAYPLPMNLPQGILIAVSLPMPPLLLALVPYFYIQSHRRLKAYLA